MLIFGILLFTYASAQRTISLEEETNYLTTGDKKVPEDVSYVKDINGVFDKYTGVWNGNINGNTIEFRFNKITVGDNSFKRDKVIARIFAKDVNGNVLYNTLNDSDSKAFQGVDFSKNMKIYSMIYEGPKSIDCNEVGFIYILNNNGVLRLKFIADTDMLKANQCPQGYKFLIPDDTTITLTKQ